MKTIKCYTGPDSHALMYFLYHPETRKCIKYTSKIDQTHAIILPNGSGFHDIYMKKGKPIQISKQQFNEAYKECIKAQESEEKSKTLTKKLFGPIK